MNHNTNNDNPNDDDGDDDSEICYKKIKVVIFCNRKI